MVTTHAGQLTGRQMRCPPASSESRNGVAVTITQPNTCETPSPISGTAHTLAPHGARCDGDHRSIHVLLARISNKWVTHALELLAGSIELRFCDLLRETRGVSGKMLSATLRDLIRDGLVSRRAETVVPARVYYRLTDLGRSLTVPLDVLQRWAELNVDEIDRARQRYDEIRGAASAAPS
jgi:DNA-binding HxlR family transcriptional regulator